MPSEIKKRPFRGTESLESERTRRNLLVKFLGDRGFIEIKDNRTQNGQTIVATDSQGQRLTMRVRLCWRRRSKNRDSNRVERYSAAQLLAAVKDSDWVGSISKKVERELSKGVTHYLFIQNKHDNEILYAALVPLSEVVSIWAAQRATSARLISQGKLGRRTKNHAENGVSPTVWLQDDDALEVAEELWSHAGVRDLAKIERHSPVALSLADSEAQRLPQVDSGQYNSLENDRRKIIERQIRERRGQQQFRDSLRKRHGNKCMLTGSTILAVLEAAHIQPYRGEEDNHPQNGLLLRSDIHTLFDLDMIGIHPKTLQIELLPSLQKEYGFLSETSLLCSPDCPPSDQALRIRYESFQRKRKSE